MMNTTQYSPPFYGLSSVNPDSSQDDVADVFNILGMVVTSMVCLLGSTGNALTMSTIIHQLCWLPLRMRSIPKLTANTVLIFNLALADFLYCAVALPPMFSTYYCNFKDEVFGEKNSTWFCQWLETPSNGTYIVTSCEIVAFFRYFIAIVEWMILGIMALERCVAIYSFSHRTHHSKFFSPTKTVCICLVLWLLSMMTELWNVFADNFDYNKKAYKCDYSYNSTCLGKPGDVSNLKSPRGIFFVFKGILPSILILIGYLLILYQIYFSAQRIMEAGTEHTQASTAMRRSQSTKIIRRLLSVYIICVFPILLFNIVQTVLCFEEPIRGLSISLYCIYWIQYWANSLIYVVSNKKYRFAYKQFFAFVRCSDIPIPTHILFSLQGRQGIQRNNHQFEMQLQPRIRTVSEYIQRFSIDSTESPNPDTISLPSMRTSTSSMSSLDITVPRYGMIVSSHPRATSLTSVMTSTSSIDSLDIAVPRYGIPETRMRHR